MQITRPQTPMGHLWNSIQSLGEVPSEATFSRAVEAFARDGRPQQIYLQNPSWRPPQAGDARGSVRGSII